MRKVFLYGELGNSLGKEWDLEVDSVQEALWAIEANTNKLTDFMRKNAKKFAHYTFVVGDKDIDKHQLRSPIKNKEKQIHIMPQVAGSELASLIKMIAVAVITSLIMQAIFKPPKPSEAVQTNSYLFAGTQNVAAQGIPVPLGYGRLKVGSVVISAATRHHNYAKKLEAVDHGPIRLGGYDPEVSPFEQTRPGVPVIIPAGNMGTLDLDPNSPTTDVEFDDNGKPYIPGELIDTDDFFGDDCEDPFDEGCWDPCWIAREVYGINNPSWLVFRFWLLNYSPNWFCNWYIQNGKKTAEWISRNTWIKPVIRRWMDARIKFLGKTLKDKSK